MMSDTLYVILHIPLFNTLLQFNLYRINNIPNGSSDPQKVI